MIAIHAAVFFGCINQFLIDWKHLELPHGICEIIIIIIQKITLEFELNYLGHNLNYIPNIAVTLNFG